MLDHTDFVIALMLEEHLLSPEALEQAARHAAASHISVPEAAVALGAITARDLATVRASVSECPFVNLDDFDIDLHNASLLPRSVAERTVAFPLFNTGKVVTVGMADPLDLKAVDRLRALLKANVEPVLCEPRALLGLIERAYSLTGAAGASTTEDDHEPAGTHFDADEEPIVAAVNQIIIQALEQGASDIHLGPDEHELHLRYRIDGVLQARQGPALASHPGLVQRIKVMANLDLTQTRRPQDGKFRFQAAGSQRPVDVRVSIIPTVCGENVVLRLLSPNLGLNALDDLGLAPDLKVRLEELLARPHGMILASGPTGAGKTTTLYACLRKLNTPSRHSITIEDPVEIRLPLVRQVQVHTEIGMTFAGALRAILRQDPDIILVGEIRDEETARIAIQAALTGHLVLSTLHTNDAPGAVARLRDFNCPPFAINAALLCVLAQRLVRRICPDCAKPHTPDPVLARRFDAADMPFRRGVGCPRCLNSGMRGRIGVYEMLEATTAFQLAVERGTSTAALRTVALGEGMRPLWSDGLDKARQGLTTLEEVARIAAATIDEDRSIMADFASSHGLPREVRMSA